MRPANPDWLASSIEKFPLLYSFAALSSSSDTGSTLHAVEFVEHLQHCRPGHLVAHESTYDVLNRFWPRVFEALKGE